MMHCQNISVQVMHLKKSECFFSNETNKEKLFYHCVFLWKKKSVKKIYSIENVFVETNGSGICEGTLVRVIFTE